MTDKEHCVRMRAYEIWEREGRRDGRADDHWRQAEAEIARELSQRAADDRRKGSAGKGAKAQSNKARPSAPGEKTAKKPTQGGGTPSDARTAKTRSGSGRRKAAPAPLGQASPA